MILRFEKVRLHNFSCYRDAELDLDNMGYAIVSGINNSQSDNALSNGSGKSSIFNAICYAMTGETAQGLSNNIENIYTDPNDCWVELEFRADDDDFLIRRYKTPRSDLKIYINGEDRSGKGIRESQQLLEGYLPDLTSQLLGSIIILGQGLPYRFTHNTPSARKYLLEKLTKSDYMVESVKTKLDNRKEELRQLLRSFEDSNVSNTTQINVYYERLDKLRKELDEYDSSSEDGSIEDKLNDIHETLNAYNKELIELNDEKISIENSINQLNQQKLEFTNKSSEELSLEISGVDTKINSVNSVLVDKKAESKSLENEIKKLDSIVDICPTCGQKIPDVHKIDTTDLKNKLSEHKKITKELLDEYNSYIKEKETITKSHKKKLDDQYVVFDGEINNLRKKLDKINSRFNSLTKMSNQLFNEENRLKYIQSNYSKLHEEILDITGKIEVFKETKNNIENNIRDINEHLNVIQNLITLAKREFRSVLLDNVIRYMDRKAKQYAVDVFGAEIITIETDENYINVIFANKYYEALSGGEKQKVDIIIQLALRDLLSNQLNLHANLFVLDEALDFLDEKGADAILKLIQTSMTDVSSVFMISHHAVELNISYDTLIEVTKGDDGVSTISVK